jgi:predicted transcriptional regulator
LAIKAKIKSVRTTGFEPHIGQRLRKFRQLVGVTQCELAARLRVGQTALSRLERRTDMLVSSMLHYLEALGAGVRIDAKVTLDTDRAARIDGTQPMQLSLPIIGGPTDADRRDLVLSIKPEYSNKIVAGEKTVELRRRFPTTLQPGTIVLIYATSPTRALIGLAEIAGVLQGPISVIWKKFASEACIKRTDFDSYFTGAEIGFAIKLRGARPLRRVLELQEFRDRFQFEPPQFYLYAPPELREALTRECSEISN